MPDAARLKFSSIFVALAIATLICVSCSSNKAQLRSQNQQPASVSDSGFQPTKDISDPFLGGKPLPQADFTVMDQNNLMSVEQARENYYNEIEENSKPAPRKWKQAWSPSDITQTHPKVEPDRRKVGDEPYGGIIVKNPGKERREDLEKFLVPMPDSTPKPQPPGQYENMIKIPANTISMGKHVVRGNKATIYDTTGYEVQVNEFYIDKYEVTNADYRKFVIATGHRVPSHWPFGFIPEGKENHPVVCVSWEDAKAYAEWAGKRLPTEAEWELAAGGAEGRRYPWGYESNTKIMNVRESWGEGEQPDTVSAIPEPGSDYEKNASPYGVIHMAGNAMEWVEDDFKPYPGNHCQTWKEYEGGNYKVLRGGSFFHDHSQAFTYNRYFDNPETWYSNYYGFRCADD